MNSLSIVIPNYNSEKPISALCYKLIELLADDFRLDRTD